MNYIKKILKEQGRTQKWLAQQMDKTEATVCSWVNNVYDPSLAQLQQIADLLGVDFKELI